MWNFCILLVDIRILPGFSFSIYGNFPSFQFWIVCTFAAFFYHFKFQPDISIFTFQTAR